VDIKETKDIEFGNFNHTMTIYNINTNHNGTYACIAAIGARHDMVKWKLIVRGIFYKMVFCNKAARSFYSGLGTESNGISHPTSSTICFHEPCDYRSTNCHQLRIPCTGVVRLRVQLIHVYVPHCTTKKCFFSVLNHIFICQRNQHGCRMERL
jgi:hypothetical protein